MTVNSLFKSKSTNKKIANIGTPERKIRKKNMNTMYLNWDIQWKPEMGEKHNERVRPEEKQNRNPQNISES